MNKPSLDEIEIEIKRDHTPYLQFYTSDWTAGTTGFTLEQRGFYFELLRAMWEQKGGLPDDLHWLKCAARCSLRATRRLRSFLVNKRKLRVVDGLLINARMDRDIRAWKRKVATKLGQTSAELQGNFALNFPENPTKSKAPPSHIRGQIPDERDQGAPTFQPRVIPGGRDKRDRPAAIPPKWVSEDALDQVPRIAPGWDRQMLHRKWLTFNDDDISHIRNPDSAFLAWVKKFTKGNPPR
jgi:uncharacterized protein YdaU (DUF1376 family)